MTLPVLILLARLLLPVAIIVFAAFFHSAVTGMAQSERLFPILLTWSSIAIATVIIITELVAFAKHRDASTREQLTHVDEDGLRQVGWLRSGLVVGACLLYLLAIGWLGLMLTGFLVYLACAAALIPDRSDRRHWTFAITGAAIAGVVFDFVFRVWLELPLPGFGL